MTKEEQLLASIKCASCDEHILNAVETYNESSDLYKSIEYSFRYLVLLNKDKSDKITLAERIALFNDKNEALHFFERKIEELIQQDYSRFFTLSIIDLQTSLFTEKYIND
jgi:hypothetical protein